MFGYRKITIATPQCLPVRDQITRTENMLKHYGFQDFSVTHDGDAKVGKQILYHHIGVKVHTQAANWAEYLLCRAGHGLLSTPINPKNIEYAQKWLGSNAAKHGWFDGAHAGGKLPPGAVIGEINPNPNMPFAWQDQPRQPGRSKRRRKRKAPSSSGLAGLLRELLP